MLSVNPQGLKLACGTQFMLYMPRDSVISVLKGRVHVTGPAVWLSECWMRPEATLLGGQVWSNPDAGWVTLRATGTSPAKCVELRITTPASRRYRILSWLRRQAARPAKSPPAGKNKVRLAS